MNWELILGLGTGIIFGVLLQQGRVLRFEKQVGAMLFRDMTIFKFMLSAIIVGMVGVNLLVGLSVISLKVKGTLIAANLIGGALFGAGWAIMGFCPGTSVGAVAEGRWHAVWAILGMLGGAAVYAEVYPTLTGNVLEDEKILGTCHVAFGASAGIGGVVQVPIHIDCVVLRPTVAIDGEAIVRDGELLV